MGPNGQDFGSPLTARRVPALPIVGTGIGSEPSSSAATPEPQGGPYSQTDAAMLDERQRAEVEWVKEMTGQGYTVFRSQGAVEPSPYRADRLTGPVQVFANIVREWNLSMRDATALLGYEGAEQSVVEAILAGRSSLRGRDTKTRIVSLYRIQSLTAELFRDGQMRWLQTPVAALGNVSPLEYVRDGAIEKVLRLRQFVEHIAGQ